MKLDNALMEPLYRNTAPALSLAALSVAGLKTKHGKIVIPADQTVSDGAAFTAAMQRAVQDANNDTIVIIGVSPRKAETGYGYIQTAATASPNTQGEAEVIQVARSFVEKHKAELAQQCLSEGNYF